MSTEDDIQQLEQRWAEAEQRGDIETLAGLTADDFTLVGPLGFVLDKQQWLARYRGGDLVTKALNWHDAKIRNYGECAVVIGVHSQKAAFRGNPVDGEFRSTHIAIRREGQWLLAGIQLSPIGAPPAFTQNPPASPEDQEAR
jgi:ketosteroid isomerase-like protein